MLSGQYDILINNILLTKIIAIILLIIPILLLFLNKKWIFFYYTISIVANLPLIFSMAFNFSYEVILGFVIVICLAKDIIKQREIRYLTTKENLILIIMLVSIMGVNLVTSFFNFNLDAFLLRLYIYIVNLVILLFYTYYLKDYKSVVTVKCGFLIGIYILIISMIIEMVYGHYTLGLRNMRPAGLLLDPNVCAFALNLGLIISFIGRKKNNFLSDLLVIGLRVLIIFAVFLTVSRSAYIGTIYILISFIIYYSKSKDRWIVPALIIILTAVCLIFNKVITNFINNIYQIIDLNRIFPIDNPSLPPGGIGNGGDIPSEVDYSNSRLALIKAAISIFANNIFLGVGIGNVLPEIEKITSLPMNAHNLFLQLLAESGIFMLISLLIVVYFVLLFINKVPKKNKFIIISLFGLIFIESMFNHNILNINIIYLIFSLILTFSMLGSNELKVFTISKKNFKNRK